jgi:glutathione S-transferase
MITISAFAWVPDFAQGQVRDLRVRWALEEAEFSYRTRLLAQGDQDKPEYRAMQPFGQVPIFEENGFVLFETGAIVLHIGERSEPLLPKDPAARARDAMGDRGAEFGRVIAAGRRDRCFLQGSGLGEAPRPSAVQFAEWRLKCLANNLDDKPYLDAYTLHRRRSHLGERAFRIMPEPPTRSRLRRHVERCTARAWLQARLGRTNGRLLPSGVTHLHIHEHEQLQWQHAHARTEWNCNA